uniref:Protein N-terminal asparagine amidohydrolase-like n=1 Tax=Hirondellea gigas TaxID=1518452 RepID=A0A2P2IFM7_9CRUS
MVVYVDGHEVRKCPQSTAELFSKHAGLVSRASEWRQTGSTLVPEAGSLYVAQREFAIVRAGDNRVAMVGSDDATTCHVLVFHNRQTGAVAVAHFDGGKNEKIAIHYMVQTILESGAATIIDVYAIGGFYRKLSEVKGTKESHKLSLKLLSVCIDLDCKFNIVQWCCCEQNSRVVSEPKDYIVPYFFGLCWDRKKGVANPAVFASQGPDAILKAASRWSSSKHMLNRYNDLNHSITIQPFRGFSNSGDWHNYRNFTDEQILKYFSTSPSAEPPHFASRMREMFSLFADHPNPTQTLFTHGKPKVYVLEQTGLWEFVN